MVKDVLFLSLHKLVGGVNMSRGGGGVSGGCTRDEGWWWCSMSRTCTICFYQIGWSSRRGGGGAQCCRDHEDGASFVDEE